MIFTFLLAQGGAFAHEGESHDNEHKADAQMQKLHHIMPMYAQAQAKIDEALTTRDAAMIKAETGKILATLPDLKNAQPHKNLKQIATFRKIASAFAGDVKKTAALAKAGDFGGAKNAFRFAQARCNECHQKFRD
jgi:cytochrome c556